MDGMTVHAGAREDADARAGLVAEIASHAGPIDAAGSFPHASLRALREAGVLALTARVEDGGQGAGLAEAYRLVSAVAAGCASTALILGMQLTHLAAAARNPAWPERVRRMVAEGAARDGALINALRVEPELGTPARGGLPATLARRDGAGWAISGHKIYSTGAPGLTWGLAFARTDEEVPRAGLFLVPMRAAGVRIVESWDQLGLRASGSHDVLFDDVRVPGDHAVDLRAPGDWLRGDPQHAAWNAALIGGLYTGVATAARDWLVGFLRARVPANLGAALATLPRMQEAVGAIEARLLSNRDLLDGLATRFDRGDGHAAAQCGLIKQVTCENAITVVEQAVKLIGNHALARRNPLERHLRDVLCARIHTPQEDAALVAAGRAALLAGVSS